MHLQYHPFVCEPFGRVRKAEGYVSARGRCKYF
jgi:hypothetical protein